MKKDINKINKITCTKCKRAKGVRPDVLKARCKRTGLNLKELLKTYICQACRKKHQITMTGEVDNNIITTEQPSIINGFWTEADYMFPYKTSNEYIIDATEISKNVCLMPILLLEHNCKLCIYYKTCICTDSEGHIYKDLFSVSKKIKPKRKTKNKRKQKTKTKK